MKLSAIKGISRTILHSIGVLKLLFLKYLKVYMHVHWFWNNYWTSHQCKVCVIIWLCRERELTICKVVLNPVRFFPGWEKVSFRWCQSGLVKWLVTWWNVALLPENWKCRSVAKAVSCLFYLTIVSPQLVGSPLLRDLIVFGLSFMAFCLSHFAMQLKSPLVFCSLNSCLVR